MPSLAQTVVAINRAKKVEPFHGNLLALDPGETTGFATFYGADIIGGYHVDWREIDQLKTWPMKDAITNLEALIGWGKFDCVVMESYRIYSWMSDDHKWSPVNTIQLIGAIQTLCIQRNIPYIFQSAQIAKQFVTDELLKKLGLYQKGIRHGRDATRHGVYYLCFGSSQTTPGGGSEAAPPQ